MKITKGWKYRTEERAAFRILSSLTILHDYRGAWWSLLKGPRVLVLEPGYAWDGATWFPDFDWVLTPSAGHDALHQAIALGVIPESENHLIDEELGLWIAGNKGREWLLRVHGAYVRTATHLVNERTTGALPAGRELPRLRNELTQAQYLEALGLV